MVMMIELLVAVEAVVMIPEMVVMMVTATV